MIRNTKPYKTITKTTILGLQFVLLTLWATIPLSAQNSSIAPGDTGVVLINYLHDNYDVETSLGYSTARDHMFAEFDNQSGRVYCVYTGYNVSADNRDEAQNQGFNTEHTWPQGFFDRAEPMRSDLHHLYPTLGRVNSARSNYEFDEIDDNRTDTWYYLDQSTSSIPASNIDSYSEVLNGSAFEPREDHKGNVARAMFYFYTIYKNESIEASDFQIEDMQETLLKWHDMDPVDDREVARSEAIADLQGNQNPYVHDTTLIRRAFFPERYQQNGGGSTDEDSLLVGDGGSSSIVSLNETFLAKDFEDENFGDWTAVSRMSNENWRIESEFGGADGSSAYAEVNGYDADEASDDWLISPEIDLSGKSNPVMTFYWLYRYSGPDLQVKITNQNVPMDEPGTATWALLSPDKPATETSWKESEVDLSRFVGDVIRIAFHYTSTGPNPGESELWRVDEIAFTDRSDQKEFRLAITGNAGWRLIAPPVSNMPFSDIKNTFPLQSADQGETWFMNEYDESGWTGFEDENGSLLNGYGAALYLENSSPTLPDTLKTRGNTPENDAIVILDDNDSWNILGNPYTETIDLNKMVVNDGNLASQEALLWDPVHSGYVPALLTGGLVAPWQGFLVQNSDASSITIPYNSRTAGGGFFKTRQMSTSETDGEAFIVMQIASLASDGEKQYKDLSTILRFSDNADRGNLDKPLPLPGKSIQLASVHPRDGRLLAVDYRLAGEEEYIYDLAVRNSGITDSLALSIERITNIDTLGAISFYDQVADSTFFLTDSTEYRFEPLDPAENSNNEPRFTAGIGRIVTSIDENRDSEMPANFEVSEVYPNPFNPSTTLEFTLPEATPVQIAVYNISGQKVQQLANRNFAGGSHRVHWEASGMASGLYFIRMSTPERIVTRKALLVK